MTTGTLMGAVNPFASEPAVADSARIRRFIKGGITILKDLSWRWRNVSFGNL